MDITIRLKPTGGDNGPILMFSDLANFYSQGLVTTSYEIEEHGLAGSQNAFSLALSWTLQTSGYVDDVGNTYTWQPTTFAETSLLYYNFRPSENDITAQQPSWRAATDYMYSQNYIAYGTTENDIFAFYSTYSAWLDAPGGGTAYGGKGDDQFYSGYGADKFYGEDGNDIFAPLEGWWGGEHEGLGTGDLFDGGAGNDYMSGVIGATMRGGQGVDALYLEMTDAIAAVSVKLSGSIGKDLALGGGTFIRDFESLDLTLTSFNDRIDVGGFSVSAYYNYSWERHEKLSSFHGGDGTDTFAVDGLTKGQYRTKSFEKLEVNVSALKAGVSLTWHPYYSLDSVLLASDNFTISGVDFQSLVLTGNDWNDEFTLGSGLDISGGKGNDFFWYGGGSRMDGGAGIDFYTTNGASGTFNVAAQATNWLLIAANTYIRGFEHFDVSFSDTATVDLSGATLSSKFYQGTYENEGASNFSASASTKDTVIFDAKSRGDVMARYFDVVRGDLSGLTTSAKITHGYVEFQGFDLRYYNTTSAITFDIVGGSANDDFAGGAGNDVFDGGAGNDIFAGGGGADKLTGGAGNDRLDGGVGADVLKGGLGDDTFIIDNVGDKAYEADGQGTDRVNSSVSYSLAGQYIETLDLVGTANINATGNSLNNTLYGNDGNNVLDGATGADKMYGGLGDDTYIIQNSGDKAYEDNVKGVDTVKASVSYSLAGQYVEKLTLTGTGNINGTGNTLANTLVGNAGNNTLAGGKGNDVLTGGLGKDTFLFDTSLTSNVDTITDFSVVDDIIRLENTVFTALTKTGALASSAFYASTSGVAHDGDDRIIYETDTGKLFYDSNGNAAGGAVQFAILSKGLALTAADFFVV